MACPESGPISLPNADGTPSYMQTGIIFVKDGRWKKMFRDTKIFGECDSVPENSFQREMKFDSEYKK